MLAAIARKVRTAVEVLRFDVHPDLVASAPNGVLVEEPSAVQPQQVATCGVTHPLASRVDLLRPDPAWWLRRLRIELTDVSTDGAGPVDLGSMSLHPSNLGVTQRPEACGVTVECGERTDRLSYPELEVGELPTELMETLAGEAFELVGDQVGPFDGIGEESLGCIWSEDRFERANLLVAG